MMQAIDGRKQTLAVLCAVLLALTVLAGKYVGRKTDFGDAATMGAATTSVFAVRGQFPIHCEADTSVRRCIEGVEARRLQRRALWLGNSQLHAMNQFRAGDRNAPDLLAERLADRSVDLVTVSFGNANLQEKLVVFSYMLDRLRPDTLILPLVFDDLREDGLRDDIAGLTGDPQAAAHLAESGIGRQLAVKVPPPDAGTAPEATPQERSEASLNAWLDAHVPLWRARPEMRGDLFIGLYKLRNTVFGITPSTKRKVIPGRYTNNFGAFEAILQMARASGVRVLVYIAPIGSAHGERPYVESEYRRFKEEVAAMAARFGTEVENFEDLIPEPLWGLKDSTTAGRGAEPDFMHFTAAGHRLFAERIDGWLVAGSGAASGAAR